MANIIATVDGNEITQDQVELETQNVLRQLQGRFPPEQMKELLPQFKQQAIENLINQHLLSSAADQQGITPSNAEIDKTVQQLKSHYPTEEAFQERLEQLDKIGVDLEANIRQNLKIQMLIQKQTSGIDAATDEEVIVFFEDNPNEFEVPPQVKASHILLKTEPNEDNMQRMQKRLELSKIKGQIENGTAFADLAQRHSDCPSSKQGGDLGFFGPGQMVKPFEDVAFAMKVDEVSEIVETQFGFHLIHLTGHKPGQSLALDDVKDQIAQHLLQTKHVDATNTYISELRDRAEIKMAE